MTMDYKKVHYLYIMVYKYSPKPSSLILRSISSSSLKSAEPFETPRSFGPRLRIYEIRKLHIILRNQTPDIWRGKIHALTNTVYKCFINQVT